MNPYQFIYWTLISSWTISRRALVLNTLSSLNNAPFRSFSCFHTHACSWIRIPSCCDGSSCSMICSSSCSWIRIPSCSRIRIPSCSWIRIPSCSWIRIPSCLIPCCMICCGGSSHCCMISHSSCCTNFFCDLLCILSRNLIPCSLHHDMTSSRTICFLFHSFDSTSLRICQKTCGRTYRVSSIRNDRVCPTFLHDDFHCNFPHKNQIAFLQIRNLIFIPNSVTQSLLLLISILLIQHLLINHYILPKHSSYLHNLHLLQLCLNRYLS